MAKAKQISRLYYSTSKKTDKLLRHCSQKLLSLAKDEISSAAMAVNDMAETMSETTLARFKKLQSTGAKIISQVEDKLKGSPAAKRIVSYHEKDAAALPKSRPGHARCAFGAKLSLSASTNGYVTDHFL